MQKWSEFSLVAIGAIWILSCGNRYQIRAWKDSPIPHSGITVVLFKDKLIGLHQKTFPNAIFKEVMRNAGISDESTIPCGWLVGAYRARDYQGEDVKSFLEES